MARTATNGCGIRRGGGETARGSGTSSSAQGAAAPTPKAASRGIEAAPSAAPVAEATAQLIPGDIVKIIEGRYTGLIGQITEIPIVTLPTKVPSGSLGRIGSLKGTSDKSLFPMALGSYGHRITHQLRPINMNGRSILSETSIVGGFERFTVRLPADDQYYDVPNFPLFALEKAQ